MREPSVGGLPLGELWHDVIPRFAADIRAGGRRDEPESGAAPAIDPTAFFHALHAAFDRHRAPAPEPDVPDVAVVLHSGRQHEHAAEPQETAKVREDMRACLADGAFIAWGRSGRAAPANPRRPFAADDWRAPGQVSVRKGWVWRGPTISGRRERVRAVTLYCARRQGPPAASSPTPHRFENPIWEFGDILGWVIDRNPANFGRFFRAADFQSENYRRVFFRGGSDPRPELLHALQRGDLAAFNPEGERWCDKADWYGKDETDLSAGLRRYVCDRAAVIRVWPLAAAASPAPEPPAPAVSAAALRVARRPSRQKPFWAEASKAAFAWLSEKGYPSPGDGGQSTLETHIADWIVERGHSAAESTIRQHVKGWIEEYKADLSATPPE